MAPRPDITVANLDYLCFVTIGFDKHNQWWVTFNLVVHQAIKQTTYIHDDMSAKFVTNAFH